MDALNISASSLRNHRVVEHRALFILARLRGTRARTRTNTRRRNHVKGGYRFLKVCSGQAQNDRERWLRFVGSCATGPVGSLTWKESMRVRRDTRARSHGGSHRHTTRVYTLTREYAQITHRWLSYQVVVCNFARHGHSTDPIVCSFEERLERLSRLRIPRSRTSTTADAHWTVNLNF